MIDTAAIESRLAQVPARYEAKGSPLNMCRVLLAEVRRLEGVVEKLGDDGFANSIGRDCHDPQHDDRWCATCDARLDGIYAYRAALTPGTPEDISDE